MSQIFVLVEKESQKYVTKFTVSFKNTNKTMFFCDKRFLWTNGYLSSASHSTISNSTDCDQYNQGLERYHFQAMRLITHQYNDMPEHGYSLARSFIIFNGTSAIWSLGSHSRLSDIKQSFRHKRSPNTFYA